MDENFTFERSMELLNACINHICVARNTPEQICELMTIGFTDDELVNVFGFSKSDVNDYLQEQNDSEDE